MILNAIGRLFDTSLSNLCVVLSNGLLSGFINCKSIRLKNNAPIPKPIIHTPEHNPFLLGICSIQFFNGATYPYPINNPKHTPYINAYIVKEDANDTKNTDELIPIKDINIIVRLENINNGNFGRTIPAFTHNTEIVTIICKSFIYIDVEPILL